METLVGVGLGEKKRVSTHVSGCTSPVFLSASVTYRAQRGILSLM